MKRIIGLTICILGILITSCDRKLPPERQRQLQAEAEARKIQRVTENQMVEYVQEKGEQVERIIGSGDDREKIITDINSFLDSKHSVEYVLPTQATEGELSEVMQAYMFSVAEGNGTGANLQKLENGDMLFTLPDVSDSSGIKVLRGIWKVEFNRKNMVNEIFRQTQED